MNQAYQNIESNKPHYKTIEKNIKSLVETWNSTHNTKADFRTIADIFKRIFNYHKWITIEDIKPAIERGLMGEFGENKGLNDETIYKWFTGWRNHKNKLELKNATFYKTQEPTVISEEQRKNTRQELVKIFLEIYDGLKRTKEFPINFNHYTKIYYKWMEEIGMMVFDKERVSSEIQAAKSVVETKANQEKKKLSEMMLQEDSLNRVKSKLLKERLRELAEMDYDLEAELTQLI